MDTGCGCRGLSALGASLALDLFMLESGVQRCSRGMLGGGGCSVGPRALNI